jgi:hypothetical protein
VFLAILAEKSVGKAIASKALVCKVCSSKAAAANTVRATLLKDLARLNSTRSLAMSSAG